MKRDAETASQLSQWRVTWVKDPHPGKRERFERPSSEWIVDERLELRILDQRARNAFETNQLAAYVSVYLRYP